MVSLLVAAGGALANTVPAYTQLTGAVVTSAGPELLLSVMTSGAIPRLPDAYINSVLAFGYAWVDAATGQGVVIVMHPSFVDSTQDPVGWHTHPIVLTAGTAKSTFCLVSAAGAEGGIAIAGSTALLVIGATRVGVTADALTVAASFVAQPDSGCPTPATTGLGIVVLSTSSL